MLREKIFKITIHGRNRSFDKWPRAPWVPLGFPGVPWGSPGLPWGPLGTPAWGPQWKVKVKAKER